MFPEIKHGRYAVVKPERGNLGAADRENKRIVEHSVNYLGVLQKRYEAIRSAGESADAAH